MTEDVFLIDIPVFVPHYDKNKKYGWSRYKDNLWDLLNETTGGYCMYCYDTVWINRQRRGQIEHGIEKANSERRLTNCVPNLGLACENCNIKYKKRGEKSRKLCMENIHEFEKGVCGQFNCKKMCGNFEKLRREYVKNGKILIQPFETKAEADGHSLRLQYDLLQCRYIPSRSAGEYTEEELEIIRGHIKLFGLNSSERKNYAVGTYCKNVIDYESVMTGVPYDNLIVDLFRRKLEEFTVEEAVKICRIVYGSAFVQSAT